MLALAAVFATSQALAYDVGQDIQRLIAELGAHATPQLIEDLSDPNLLPANGIHRPRFIWNVSAETQAWPILLRTIAAGIATPSPSTAGGRKRA